MCSVCDVCPIMIPPFLGPRQLVTCAPVHPASRASCVTVPASDWPCTLAALCMQYMPNMIGVYYKCQKRFPLQPRLRATGQIRPTREEMTQRPWQHNSTHIHRSSHASEGITRCSRQSARGLAPVVLSPVHNAQPDRGEGLAKR